MPRFERIIFPKAALDSLKLVDSSRLNRLIQQKHQGLLNDEEEGQVFSAVACIIYQEWQNEHSPYYRLYPSVVEAFHKLKYKRISQLDFSRLPDGLNTVEFEIPECFWDVVGIKSGIISVTDYNKCTTLIQAPDGSYAMVCFSKNVNDGMYTHPANEKYMGIILGVLSLSTSSDLVKPIVLSKDKRRYEDTKDELLVEKARRRGLIGFNVGEYLPTKEELRRMVEENELAMKHGQKAPHVRCSYLGIRWTGTGRTLPKIVRISSCVINKDLLTKIPQGYYDK